MFTYVIGGVTIHHAFNFRYAGHESLSDENMAFYRDNLSQLKLIICDEISLVPADMLYKIHLRLCEIFQNKEFFGGISVICVGDLLQVIRLI